MIVPARSPKMASAFARVQSRLAMPFTATPAFLFIPVGFAALLLIYTALETNPRLLSTAKPIALAGNEADEAPLWYSVAPDKDGIVVTSNTGEAFQIQNEHQDAGIKKLGAHLKDRGSDSMLDVALSNRMDQRNAFVVLSVDERLTYFHVRPVIYALASAGITRYGFEGRILKD